MEKRLTFHFLNKISVFIIFTNALFISGCKESNKILKNRNFENGDWLLVNKDYAKRTIQIIDDEKVLSENIDGLFITPLSECGGTTCDGFISLYKNGKLVAENEYLERNTIYESKSIITSYKNASEADLRPIDKSDFDKKWDSLIKAGCYPTIYHEQPADKDIIWYYKITN